MILNIPCQLFLYFLFIPAFSSATDTLAVNQSLSGRQTLVSLNERFEMGFFKPGNSSNYYIGIWFNKAKVTIETVVWVANRDTPIYDTFSSQLKIIAGNLVLLDETKTQIWSTNMTTTTTPASSAVLRNDGNLVLRYGSNSEPPAWQSFDHPTHTFLAGMKVGYNKRTNTKQVFTSWKSIDNPAVGLFSYEIDQNQKKYVLKWNKSVEYWATGSWYDKNQFFDLVPEMRFVIDVSGQTMVWTWSDATRNWNLFWSRPRDVCQVYGGCGDFGVCNTQTFPSCSCLTEFQPRSQSDWNLNEFSGGCVRKTALDCKIKKYMFILINVQTRFLSVISDNEARLLDESSCSSSCLDYCLCFAYTFISNTCKHWNQEELNNISLGFVSGDIDLDKSQFHIKVASRDLPHRIKNKEVNLGVVAGSVVGVVCVLMLIVLITLRIKRTLVRKTTMEGALVAYVYKDLQIATKKFSDKLGGGSFGSVFKGVLHDSSIVAVKKLESVSQGEKEFRSEVSTIGIIQHVNLVRLRGFCAQGKSRLLVYDYMPNGSLNSHLFNEKQDNHLTWKTRYQIALGIARGLVYLHEECIDYIIHCDMKPENILLDANFCPKIADFGLAKLIGRNFSRVLTTMKGTRGYLAPEWLSGLAITPKVDVFSYGMMLFELIHGTRNSYQSEDGSFTFFPSMAANVLMAGGDILSLLDSRLNRESNVEEMTKIFKVAYWCIQHEEDIRPSMSEVEHILEGVSDVSMPPIPQYVKFFADDMEDFLFFKQSSKTENSQV